MKRFERLDEATAPDGTVLTLFRHDGAYVIRVGNIELMSTRRHQSEDRLAELVCEPLKDAPAPRVLIGGLGLGFTLREALRLLPRDAEVVVVELLEAVIRWNEHPDYALAGAELRDPRVTVVQGDVADVIASRTGEFDGIMLDVDNGADALTTAANRRLYDREGIRVAVAALRPGGVVGYWSADADAAFARALRGAGLAVSESRERAYGGGGHRHTLYLGRRGAPSRPTTPS